VGNRTLPLPERSRNQTPPGIGQLPEQTLRNTGHVGDDKAQLFPRSAGLMIAAVGDVSDANLVDYTRAGIRIRPRQQPLLGPSVPEPYLTLLRGLPEGSSPD
jgi:hypothetical protein